jgi:hypothetical protein
LLIQLYNTPNKNIQKIKFKISSHTIKQQIKNLNLKMKNISLIQFVVQNGSHHYIRVMQCIVIMTLLNPLKIKYHKQQELEYLM